jgi:hypothetical protein
MLSAKTILFLVDEMITINNYHGQVRRELSSELKQLEHDCDCRTWLAILQWSLYPNHEQQLEFMSDETKQKLSKLGVI